MSNRVFVVQNQHRWDRAADAFVPKFDLSAAGTFGELVYLLSPTAAPFRPDPIVEELKDKLQTFDDADFLLLVGNPVLIGIAVAIAASFNNGDVAMLQWSGKDQRYLVIRARDLLTAF